MATPAAEESIRYRRQLIMPEIGEAGQRRIRQSTVLIAGIGGLGALSAWYMAAAGVGQLKIVDGDTVSLHNLNRQVLYTTADIGEPKTVCACRQLSSLNPACRIEALRMRIDTDTVDPLVANCDLIIDGSDTIGTRWLLNRASVRRGVPFIFGGVSGFDGMVASFIPGRSSCLACLFPEEASRPVEETGIVGPTAGAIASLQCLEAIKLLIGREADLAGTLFQVHGLGMRIRKTSIPRNPDCPVCAMPGQR